MIVGGGGYTRTPTNPHTLSLTGKARVVVEREDVAVRSAMRMRSPGAGEEHLRQ